VSGRGTDLSDGTGLGVPGECSLGLPQTRTCASTRIRLVTSWPLSLTQPGGLAVTRVRGSVSSARFQPSIHNAVPASLPGVREGPFPRFVTTIETSGLGRTAFDLAVYAPQRGSPLPTQDSLPAAGPALPRGIGYPHGSNERIHILR